MRILITGGNGYVAQSLEKGLSSFSYDITCITRKDFDLCDTKSTEAFFKTYPYFDVVIHTATKGGSRLQKDNAEVFYQNIKAFQNLIYNSHHYGKLIQFGSGAELNQPSSPYGLSKKIINDLCQPLNRFYNIRIFGVFDEHELDTRFIKSNINRYLNNENLYVFADKMMDFFYMKDLVTLVNYYIENDHPPKVIDCTYKTTYSLNLITSFINNLGDHRCRVKQEWIGDFPSYSGKFTDLGLNYIGLKGGIKQVYNKLQ